MANIGMMNEAYFVSKNVLIEWINNFLQIRIEKVEHCATGAIYCHLFDSLHPGTIKMSRVDFTVRQEYEYTKNWKLLQTAFITIGIKKSIPVQRLIKARYQDNLEFLQWMYKYTKDVYNGDYENPNYDALQRRSKSKGGKEFSGIPGQPIKTQITRKRRIQQNTRNNNRDNNNTQGISRTTSRQNYNNNNSNNNNNNFNNNNNNSKYKFELDNIKKENNELKNEKNILEKKLNDLNNEYDNLAKTAADIEKERDFYFEKVLKCEQICKDYHDQNMPLLKNIYNLLYQTDNNEHNAQDNNMNNDNFNESNNNNNEVNNNNDNTNNNNNNNENENESNMNTINEINNNDNNNSNNNNDGDINIVSGLDKKINNNDDNDGFNVQEPIVDNAQMMVDQ